MTQASRTIPASGAVIEVPLNRLKVSPRNARQTPHGEAAVAALAASIAVKGLLQAPVVEAELGADGETTGAYLVTIGEGRRLALRLLAKRKVIAKTAPIRCVLDAENDPFEISLDENVTRTAMHPADQFEAFRTLAETRGLSAEEIGARFGVNPQVVRQRLRLGAVSPRLMAAYRAEEIALDVLMAFAVSEDHDRQEQVFEQLSWNRTARNVRAAMTEAKVAAHDRRAVFVGLDVYAEAGGAILRDLFTEDGGGWLEDVALLDRLALEKLEAIAAELRAREGWLWSRAGLDYPHDHGCARVYPHTVERSQADQAAMAALSEAYDALVDEWDSVEDLPPEIEARFKALDAQLEAFGEAVAFDAEDVARGGLLVILGHDGQARIERGFIRPEDAAPEPDGEAATDDEAADAGGAARAGADQQAPEDEAEDESAPLSERLVLDLSAHKTLALRVALADHPAIALVAVVHTLALSAFHGAYDKPSCLDLRLLSAPLDGHAPGIDHRAAGVAMGERHGAWAARLPRASADLWRYLCDLPGDDLLSLLAHCAALSVNAVRNPLDRRPAALAHAEVLAQTVGLDLTATWSATGPSYLGRVTKARVLEAVAEGVSAQAAERMAGLKKPAMVEAAEQALAGTGWLPAPLRTQACAAATEETLPPAMAAE